MQITIHDLDGSIEGDYLIASARIRNVTLALIRKPSLRSRATNSCWQSWPPYTPLAMLRGPYPTCGVFICKRIMVSAAAKRMRASALGGLAVLAI
jgi:hypothetical protein